VQRDGKFAQPFPNADQAFSHHILEDKEALPGERAAFAKLQ
jgi:hypothetical protein